MNVTQWHGCYSGSWQGILVPDAFAHPAKVAPGLSYRIYRYMIDAGYIAPGDSVFDPFGGIGGFGYHAMLLGLHWTGVELEPRFVELGQRNIDKWRRDLAMLNGTLGTARLLQGDSRRLLEVVGGGMGAAVSSPPFQDSDNRGAAAMPDGYFVRADGRPFGEGPAIRATLGDTPGQLGSMPSGDYGAAVSSPPYADAVNGTGEGPGARYDPIHHNGDNSFKASSDSGYGSTPGNVGNMRDGGFEGATERNEWLDSATLALFDVLSGAARERAQEDAVDTFWTAARAIVEQTYAALRPGGYAAWVTGDFIRNGQRVEFGRQWMQLCEACGFQMVEWITASKVDKHPAQLDLFGGSHSRDKERVSFFRRMANKKNPQNAITSENVIILRKPL